MKHDMTDVKKTRQFIVINGKDVIELSK